VFRPSWAIIKELQVIKNIGEPSFCCFNISVLLPITFSEDIGAPFELQAQNQPSVLSVVLAWCLEFISAAHVLNEVTGIRTLCIAVYLRIFRFEAQSNIDTNLSDCGTTSRLLVARFVPVVLCSLKRLTDAFTENSIERRKRERTFRYIN
jgi:hypothetical protein